MGVARKRRPTIVLIIFKTVFFVGFSFYIPEDSTARIAVSIDQTSLPLLGCWMPFPAVSGA